MECRLLFSEFKNETTISLVQDKVGGISGNHLAHRAVAFKLGLRAALDLEECSTKTDMKGVALQCWNSKCVGNKELVPYSLVTSCTTCPRCGAWDLRCTGCRWIQQSGGARCASCKKYFL